MPRWFRNGNGRIQPERQAPENEGNEHDATAEQQRREALRREEQRRAAQRRARQKAEAELNFAKSLYDTTDVKVAGKTAFSKISTLLVRYNRLNDIRKNNEEIANQRKAEEKISFDKKMADIESQRNDILKSKHTDEWKNEKIKKLDSKKKDIEELYADTVNRINAFGNSVDQESLTTIDTDNSGIRGTLMLSGKTSAGMGYTLTEGSREDLIKAGMYVDDVSGKDGSLMSQMSLLDNAVNTGGIELDENDRDTGGMGARYNLSHIMRNMTAEDLKLMNSGRGRDLKVDMDLLEESRKDENKMKELFGEEKEKQDIDEAAQERGVEKQIKNSVSDNIINTGVAAFNLIKNKSRIFSSLYKNIKPRQRMRVVKYGLTPEAKLRAMGKAGSVNRPGQAEKYEKLLGSYSGFNTGGGFFGMLGAYSERKRRSFSDDHDKRREYYMERSRTIIENLRKRAQNDTERLKRINDGKQPERSPKRVSINENDSFEGAMKRIRINEKSAIDDLLAAGELDEKAAAKQRQYDDIDRMLKNLSEAQDDKSAAHMMAAYKMMGASMQELLDFRLALIAYMVPSGKKTVAQIVNESHTVGIVGDEGAGDVDENADKDVLFSKLRRKADYI
ncbi:MAG: hypothetical protein IJM34_10865, partial [Lachnospiraceae bacterium]|nr:hypothetical protein [Lachnospiraceae bacterium]